jgi:hypothetical protein
MSIDVLARRRMALLEQREAIEAEIKSVDAQLIDAVEVGGHIDLDGEPVFRVQQKRDFRVDLAEKVLPAAVITACTVTVEQVDKAKLKSYAEAMGVIDACLKTSVPFVSAVKR